MVAEIALLKEDNRNIFAELEKLKSQHKTKGKTKHLLFTFIVCTMMLSLPGHCGRLVEIVIKEDGKFLDLTGVPNQLRLRSGLRKYMYRRNCYDELIEEILTSLPLLPCKTVAIQGATGIGKSSLFLVLLKMLLDDPSQLGLETRSFYYQTRNDKIWLYQHENKGTFTVRFVQPHEQLDASIVQFADMETVDGTPIEHVGMSFIFSSSQYKELTKNGWCMEMPMWSISEQTYLFNSTHFEVEYGKEVAQRAYNNIQFCGGSIRNNIKAVLSGKIFSKD